MISTRDLSLLPDIEGLRHVLQSMSVLDAILCPEWEYRYYSFNCTWDHGEQMGAMRDGCGDHLFAHFGDFGCWLKGFAHEYPMSPYRNRPPLPWPGVLDAVPNAFTQSMNEPAFNLEETTFCIWRQPSDVRWQIGPVEFPLSYADPDGSEYLLAMLDGRADTYRAWAVEYYQRDIDPTSVAYVYEHAPLTHDIVLNLNAAVSLHSLATEISKIGYPITAD